MLFQEVLAAVGDAPAIRRESKPGLLYWNKGEKTPLFMRIPINDMLADDWNVYQLSTKQESETNE